MEFYLQLVISGLVLGSIYALVALGFAIIFKSTSVVNFAQGELMMFGAYFCFSMVVQYKVPWIWAFLITILFSIVLALVVERLILRPMIGEPVISIIMVTIGLSSVLRSIVTAIWGTQIQVYDPPLFPEATVNLIGIPTSQVYLWSFGLSAVLLALFAVFFKYSKAGVAMRATAFSNQVALSMGIPVKNIFALAWCIASVVSAIGGILIGSINGINVQLGHFGLKVFPAVILGGLDSIPGAAIGGLIVGVLENLSDGVLKTTLGLSGIKEVAPYVFLVIILMIKPYGLFGKKEIERI
ncbi:MAG: branched-chain amino acid ABC transporter permease [Holophagaceae bacterium]|jgi:branched-chain amino acid transport system permease protein|nr:branched-chain amino acid ABC transporter permease [Holophagaceae bacterium]